MFRLGQRVRRLSNQCEGNIDMMAGRMVRVKFVNGYTEWFWPYEVEAV